MGFTLADDVIKFPQGLNLDLLGNCDDVAPQRWVFLKMGFSERLQPFFGDVPRHHMLGKTHLGENPSLGGDVSPRFGRAAKSSPTPPSNIPVCDVRRGRGTSKI